MVKKCESCHYRREMFGFPAHPACHYAVEEGRLRGCEPEVCVHYREKRKWRANAAAERAAEEILRQ